MGKYSKMSWQERKELRMDYFKKQNGKCMFCEHSLNAAPPKEITDKKIHWKLFPDNFMKHPIHLQHCHKTDETEGVVHAYCNAVMWQYDGK